MNLSTRILLPIALTVAAGASFAEGPLQGNEVFSFTSQATHAEVRGQAIAAQNAGLIANGEIIPVQKTETVGKTRAQVAAETAEARRLGLLSIGEEMQFATPAQAEQIRLAGLQANQLAAK